MSWTSSTGWSGCAFATRRGGRVGLGHLPPRGRSMRAAISIGIASVTLLCSAANAGAQNVSFNTQAIASHAGARGITTADFDRNGWADIAHANTGRNTVTILLNQGPGSQVFTRAYDIS